MKKFLFTLAFLLAVVGFTGVAAADTNPAPTGFAASHGHHPHPGHGGVVVGYYCPVGYRLVYGSYLVYQLVWNGYGYVYLPVSTYGYYCTWP